MNLESTTSVTSRYATEKPNWFTKTLSQKGFNWGFIQFFTQQEWFIRLVNKEYWNASIYTVPIVFYSTYLAARARSPLFFTAANPAIPTGGMVGESKADISNWIPPPYRPKNALIRQSDSMTDMHILIEKAGMQFPLILKPVIGCRGLMVEKVATLAEVYRHILRFPTDFLIEEFIDYPVEAAVLYWKNPETGKSGIQSIAGKAFLSVVGDGEQSVQRLLMRESRGILQIERLEKEKPTLLKYVPQSGEKIVVEPIGNHCRGTKFLNYNHLITPEMVAAYDKIQADLPGCYVFRLDVKTPSVSDLQAGRNIKILEINGVGSDPAHIYDPATPFFEIWAAYIRLWKKIFEVSTALHRSGVPYMKLKEYKDYSKKQKEMEELEMGEVY
jgi:hypothetical protein